VNQCIKHQPGRGVEYRSWIQSDTNNTARVLTMKTERMAIAIESAFSEMRKVGWSFLPLAPAVNDIPSNVLLIEDDPVVARLIQEVFAEAEGSAFRVHWVTQFSVALERLRDNKGIDIVLLDLALLGRYGSDVLGQVLQITPNALVFILCTVDEEDVARTTVLGGAHDYLVKSHIDARWLQRVLRFVADSTTVRGSIFKSGARFLRQDQISVWAHLNVVATMFKIVGGIANEVAANRA
jgi:CheY-like chemotaxis protein